MEVEKKKKMGAMCIVVCAGSVTLKVFFKKMDKWAVNDAFG